MIKVKKFFKAKDKNLRDLFNEHIKKMKIARGTISVKDKQKARKIAYKKTEQKFIPLSLRIPQIRSQFPPKNVFADMFIDIVK